MRRLILSALKQQEHVSGQELGRRLHISRTAVWKHINELRKNGYQISSSPRAGYYFVKGADLLLPEEIGPGLQTRVMGRRILHYRQVASTQDVAEGLARAGADEGVAVIAESQTNGRGRKGRSWASPSTGGVYLSIILRPALLPSQLVIIPLIAGVAVSRAVRGVTGMRPAVRWPNDIMLGGKKAGGVLSEMRCETDGVNYVVLGIGINVNTPSSLLAAVPGGGATSLAEECGESVSRVRLVQVLLAELEDVYNKLMVSGFSALREEWKALNYVTGSWVRVREGAEETTGEAVDIDEEGFLLLRKESGDIKKVVSGDIYPVKS